MAIDGSFHLHFELERFLSRCPRLASIPEFDYLLKKADKVTEEEVVKAVGEIFLHPNYTIPLVGCFRPIVHKIVERTVSLLHLVPDLRSNSDDSMVEFNEDNVLREDEDLDNTEFMHVVDVYARSGKGLNLHELACLAFCRALDMVPFLLRLVLDYFQFAPPPFERIKLTKYSFKELAMGGSQLLNVVRASYRLLLAAPGVFTTFWDWSSFLDIVQLLADIEHEDEELKRNLQDLRWCSVQILSMVLKIRDRASSNFGLRSGEAFLCLLRWQEFCQDIALERAGWYLGISAGRQLDAMTDNLSPDLKNFSNSLPVFASEFHDFLPANWSMSNVTWRNAKPFVLTDALKKSFEMVALAVSQRWPVLLYGPAGSGKTALINKLAQEQGSQVLSIHMDEQMDGKTLLGSYVCTEQPGEFRWQPGSLTQAVCNGFWVVVEDVDKAPPDVQSILLPLLEGASSFITGHGEAIRVHEGFRLFATVTSSKLDISSITEGKNAVAALWHRVMVGAPGESDLLNIVSGWYPELDPLAGKLVETFAKMNHLAGFQFGTTAFSGSHGRFSLRDLLKWCRRVAGLGLTFLGDGLSSFACSSIYKEAVDIFAAFVTSTENRLALMKEIAKLWTVPVVETLYPVNKPVIQDLRIDLRIGRITLNRMQMGLDHDKKPFVEIRSSVHVLERIACSVRFNEPVLLVGETGAGKTTLVQNLAARIGQKLTVLNLSQQSDVADLLGGFRPIDAQSVLIPLYKEFENLFVGTFPSKDNGEFLARLRKFIVDKNWKMLVNGFQKGVRKIVEIGRCGSGNKRKRPLGEEVLRGWENFSLKLERAYAQISGSGGMIFSFVEGAFVTALKNGEWILLDEVNLAPPETLQRIIGVLEEEKGSLCLAERGDIDYIPRHPNFRIFACMNPATDAGKRDLPFSLRGRFTEYFVDDVLDDDDLVLFISQYMDDVHSNSALVSKIVQFYKAARKESDERLQDGANQKPQYSLRSLYRALEYTRKARRKFGFQKALYDGFCMFFLSLLDEPSAKLMNQLILSCLLGGKVPQHVPFDAYLMVSGNSCSDPLLESYVLTKSVKEHLSNLARAIFVGKYPVLLQGPTSSGKTSLVQYLAAITGHEFVRINNHEHTDLQEYLGSYITDSNGRLVFHEGALVKAIRNGQWIVLDELNLAPSDVLEALNRLLDDNRELYIPELREVVRAHPGFMLFATQNPPNIYGGRKMLSRAFRNRFVEIHVDEIPEDELSTILEKRCKIPASYAKKMVDVMKELQLYRQSSKVFAGKQGYITPRDLFRWANRFRVFGSSYEDLARDGYYLLAERLRDEKERRVVQEVLERHLPFNLAENEMYNLDALDGEKIVWTRSMCRLYFLVERCYKLREPVLLVGETGGGKTTVCQLLSVLLQSKLHILNCHQYTETSDFLGGFYPVRERSRIATEFKALCHELICSKAFISCSGEVEISSDINQASLTLDKISLIINGYREGRFSHPHVTLDELEYIVKINAGLAELHNKWQTIFIWQDGPLVEAMKNGDLFLVDEISLADDSVLERLNSVLEPERKLSLAEKGGCNLETITADPNFFVLATMNPGGDYGKKELSPALRNRFTEIWVPSVSELNELRSIGLERISNPQLTWIVDVMLNFWEWFNHLETGRMLTVRDFLSWVAFVNMREESLPHADALLHGVFLVLIDGISLGTNLSKLEAVDLRKKCLSFLLKQLEEFNCSLNHPNLSSLEYYGWADPGNSADTPVPENDSMQCDNRFGIYPFYIGIGNNNCQVRGFEFLAPTTRRNALRVLRALQLAKPVLLEGSPGVGKTSLVVAIGKFSGHKVVRINLSEQTDIMDLLGSDLPVESEEGMQFAWSDGILLQALKEGSWVLLDELNLAPQSVLEGLNAILDHRAEVFIPELGVTFKCPASFRVFACQNPSYQGGGRKGLPKSFLNRFTKVYIDELIEDDYISICTSLYPSIPRSILWKLVLFNKQLYENTMLYHKFAQDGSPWEFNLRDVIRSCELIQGAHENFQSDCFLNTIYVQRMRTPTDRLEVIKLYEQVFGLKPCINPFPRVQINPQYLVIGNISIQRNPYHACGFFNGELKILPGFLSSLEAITHCIGHQWLCILVGPPSSGKTSLIRLLAELTGHVLNELNLSSATDTSELLGCFEQHNALRNYRTIIAVVERYMSEYSSLQLESSTGEFIRQKDLYSEWLAFLSSIDYDPTRSSASANIEAWRTKCFDSVPLLIEIIENLKFEVEKKKLQLSWSCRDLDRTLMAIKKLQESSLRRQYSAKFEWVTGVLIKAIENGEWIVLENANLCNPTVLDRINSLVEQSGSITVNECGTVDGNPVVLHPHPQFRMFLTVNPSFGEVSRAMRNRGVEIYLMKPFWLHEGKCNSYIDEAELRDAKRFIIFSGITFSKLVDMMAKAHSYAKNEGARFDVHITYLELARWVQLFKRLITSGNQPIWSLQVSWEHTYLSSLGEVEGKDVVTHAISSYLSETNLSRIDKFQDSLICLPGGWPSPMNTRDFVLYSKETCVRRNCMYLEFLGVQASYSFCFSTCSEEQAVIASGSERIYLMDVRRLYYMMFPNASMDMVLNQVVQKQFNLDLARKMLFFAANWTIEQAVESDIELYLCWFSWFGSHVEPFCTFFSSFVDTLKEELKHPVWDRIFHCRRELLSRNSVNLEAFPIPILSVDLVGLSASNDEVKSYAGFLMNSIKCVGLVRLTYEQWRLERQHVHSQRTKYFEPLLLALQVVEKQVLNLLVVSQSFDVLFQLYNGLLENHMLFWNGIISSHFESILISWRSLLKSISRMHEFFPKEVDNFLKEIRNVDPAFSDSLRSQKSLLWVHGGHPYMAPSEDVYQKQCQLISLCEMVWPRKKQFWEQTGSDIPAEAVLYFNSELRFLAMQGVSMSAYIIGNAEEHFHIVQHLEETYQLLLRRLEFEKCKLNANVKTSEDASWQENLSICCSFPPNLLCRRRSGLDSWLDELPICDDTSFYHDMVLLSELARIVVLDVKEQHQALSNLTGHMERALNFSLNFSSRSPMDLIPHQKILWTVDAWFSVPAVNAKLASFVLEMWFRWHRFLWMHYPALADDSARHYANGILLPSRLSRTLKSETVERILRNVFSVGDYPLHCLKLRVASRDLWQGGPSAVDIKDLLLSNAQSLFEQIIYSHRKSFSTDNFTKIKYFFSLALAKTITLDDIDNVVSLLASSNHSIFTSLLGALIQPVLSVLYTPCAHNSDYVLGCAWLRIGGLRYHLLTLCNDPDPAVKYSIKYSQLMEKIDSLELEIEVRRECVLLAGSFQLRKCDDYREQLLENLRADQKSMQRRMIFRSDPGKYKKLKHELDEFRNDTASVSWINNILSMHVEQIIDQIQNWQEKASSFIERLSEEYSAYGDVIEPVQVAIYEMKLGLSLVLSTALAKKILERIGQQDMEFVLSTVYSFMRFPRTFSSKAVKIQNWQKKLTSCKIELPSNMGALDLKLLENLITSSRDFNSERVISVIYFRIAIYKNVLVRITQFISEVHLLDNASFRLLDKIFGEIASCWMDMKLQLKEKEHDEAQQFKFRPRAIKVENIIEIDLSTLQSSVASDSFTEWQELFAGEESTEKNRLDEVHESLEEEWNILEESVLNDIVDIHNQLFGSVDLCRNPGIVKVADEQKLSAFIDSYSLGLRMIKGLEGIISSNFDSKLIPEHILRICLEKENLFITPHKPGHSYNFYKDPNPSMMAKMVEPLAQLKQRILVLLHEWDGHPAFQKIVDAIDMVLSIPLSTPVAKVLSGLQFLLNKVWTLQATVAKIPLSDYLKPIFAMVSSLQKLEFESWPALLDDVHVQFEVNAGRLWFPLYSVLQRHYSAVDNDYDGKTIQSLDDFIHMSSIGEFKRRLQLLLAFHGQLHNGQCQGSYSSLFQVKLVKILYNTFGFYVQFLPKILEHIGANRRTIETELKDHQKLCRWEHTEDYLSIENSRRARQKLRKIVDKYTDLLNQPVALFLIQEVARNGVSQPMQGPQLSPVYSYDSNRKLLDVICNQTKFRDEDSQKKAKLLLQASHLVRKVEVDISNVSLEDIREVTSLIKNILPSQLLLEKGNQILDTIWTVCSSVIHCGDLWKDENKHFGKRRAFSDLLKLLESCGLSKHRSTFMEDQFNDKKFRYWLLQPSYDVQHLLMQGGASYGDVNIAASSNLKSLSSGSLESEWKTANKFYFSGLASMHVVEQICLNFHKDFTLEQVKRSCSFLDHLIAIQQDQRAAAYHFSEELKDLRECLWPLANLFPDSFVGPASCEWSFPENQNAIFNCMWQQKQLLDNLSTMISEVQLLVQKVEHNHLNSCSNVKDTAKQIFCIIEKFVPELQSSKGLLDLHLLGDNRAKATCEALLLPYGVTKHMEQLVNDNFKWIRTFKDNLSAFSREDREGATVKAILLGHFEEVFEKASFMAEQYSSDLKARKQSENVSEDANLHIENTIGVGFLDPFKEIYRSISDAFHVMLSQKNGPVFGEESPSNISEWKSFFEADTQRLKLDFICDKLVQITNNAGEQLNHCSKTNTCSLFQAHLRILYSLLNVILAFGDGLLHDFLNMHRMVSVMTYVLAEIFALLFAKGFGIPEDQVKESECETRQDASGTGMGEGAGLNDVSDQINNEDQLLGTSEKNCEGQDGLSDPPSRSDKGIEMEHDFGTDVLSVNEEPMDDYGGSGDEQLESAMGETGADSEIAKEKPWEKSDDENPMGMEEKYESGPPVEDYETNDRELRAKQDPVSVDEAGENNPEEFDKKDVENGEEAAPDGKEDAMMDKDNAYSDPSGLKIDEPNQDFDEDEANGTELMEDHVMEELQDPADSENEEEKDVEMDGTLDEKGSNNLTDSQESDHENDTMGSGEPKEPLQMGTSEQMNDDISTLQSANKPNAESSAVGLGDVVPEAKWSDASDVQDDLAPIRGLPDSSAIELPVTDTSNGSKLGNSRFDAPMPLREDSIQKTKPNPLRSVGDALDGWKERVKVSMDLEENVNDTGDFNEENANEYGYTAEFEKGTAQTLGPATNDQIDKNMSGKDLEKDTETKGVDHGIDMEFENQPSDRQHMLSSALNHGNDLERQSESLDLGKHSEESSGLHGNHDEDTRLSQSLVSINRSYLTEDINQLSKLSVSDDELGKANFLEEISSDVRHNAATVWRRYELLTTRLSQELAEQLRLVMEPTLASKLQGDYKTGKRINMKKVIPYIASHYRKDKIWLRRTRPNKRNYQVVIAVDDSRSMQESRCGDVAIEALVTVCRAMSQLEVGNLAVASFGKKGNIRLLHDFDQPFTGEAGIKMISSLTFSQENTIADEPVVDLLKYLNNMLDAAVANARLPSGHNPLQQLVLIIADGRFHEKENLKRCVRDILSRKRMVAFLLLDSPEESIMDLMEATFQGGNVKFSKYLDSFPFPYYVVLKNIEALPRTLADLLRQWFELMQYSRD
ncbi:midasin-like isoform X1 [Coffea arabica]|uniref:Midasin n=2 Tax=Coffea arabica TaxID=13443 RepID=A0ABM4U213_COFAR